MKHVHKFAVAFAIALSLYFFIGCSNDSSGADQAADQVVSGEPIEKLAEPVELAIMSHDSFAVSEEVIIDFEQDHNVRIILLPAGDTGAALNQAILSKEDPIADIFFGVDNTFMSRALAEGLFEEYESPLLDQIRSELKLDEENRLLPVDYGDVCLNYDRSWFQDKSLKLPANLMDLTLPDYENLLVVENPATSSPGLAFLMATIAEFGMEGDYNYLDYWQELRDNGILVTDGWEEAYFGYFSAASNGDRPLVVSYASSPPAEIVFADPPIDEPPSGTITEPGMCFRQVEFVGIMKGTEHREEAEAFIDYMLDVNFQEDIPLNMFVFPANQRAQLPTVFLEWAVLPEEPAFISPSDIDANREDWIRAWTDVVLR